MDRYDVIVIGGGPAGLMAAIAARETGAHTLLVEKGDKLGRKLGISGGGRCNVTNAKPLSELMQNIPGNGRFLYSALHRFSNEDIRTFFESLGIRLKEEDRGRVFPMTDRAATVVKALVDHVHDVGVEVWENTPVKEILAKHGCITGLRLAGGRDVETEAVVICTGGCSVPKTGSTGDAYPWARRLGHTIVDPFPTEVPLTSHDKYIQNRQLQGLSLRNTSITIRTGAGKRLTTEVGDMLFTHFGLSGPAALRCSHYVSVARRREPGIALTAEIDLAPEETVSSLYDSWIRRKDTDPHKHLDNMLQEMWPERMTKVLLAMAALDGSRAMTDIRNTDLAALAHLCKGFPVRLTGTLPLAQATVTGGGVSVKEIDPKTMGSKVCKGLYFAGEVMDVHAHTGGYNITVAFSTGHLAGTSAAEFAQDRRAHA